ncbi:MAG: hypothetical protein JO043_01705 [Candidatus Eremiobacteraeota bacterium]|nr:hypothetical protein [Candidatus Eremiobacteraeota bacterium]
MNARIGVLFASIALLWGCGGGYGPPAPVSPSLPASGNSMSSLFADSSLPRQNAYWTLFSGCGFPQVQIAAVPLKATSKNSNYYCSPNNGLGYSSGTTVDSSGRLWVLFFGTGHGSPGSVAVFQLPLKAKSVQQYTFVLSGTSDPDHLRFDASGNLWVNSYKNQNVFEYTGPFTKSGTLTPAITVSASCCQPSGIALDSAANLYVSNLNSTGTNSIAVFRPPYTGSPYFLNGLSAPGALAFDKNGNLYASSNGSPPAVVRYNSNDLQNGDTPSIVDSTGLPPNSYEADFAFTAKGDLYAANCGGTTSSGPDAIDVWPTSRKKFSSSLAPSVLYTNADIQQAGCAWGISIR